MWIAFVAAYMLVLQSILTALAAGAMAAPLQRDAFDGIICISHSETQQPQDGSPDRHSLPDCCITGCSMSAAPMPHVTDTLFVVSEPRESTVVFREHDSPALRLSEGRSGNPRAPPALF